MSQRRQIPAHRRINPIVILNQSMVISEINFQLLLLEWKARTDWSLFGLGMGENEN